MNNLGNNRDFIFLQVSRRPPNISKVTAKTKIDQGAYRCKSGNGLQSKPNSPLTEAWHSG